MPAHYASDVFAFCYRGGDVGRLLTYVAMTMPVFLWSGYSGFASQTRELYFLYQANTWWLTAALLYVLRSLSEWNEPAPQRWCTSADVSGPSYAVALVVHYVCMQLVHRLYWALRPTAMQLAWATALLLGIPAVLLWSGNVAWAHVVQGALIGAGVALGSSFFLYYFFMYERFAELAHSPLGRRIGWHHYGGALVDVFYQRSSSSSSAVPPASLPEASTAHATGVVDAIAAPRQCVQSDNSCSNNANVLHTWLLV